MRVAFESLERSQRRPNPRLRAKCPPLLRYLWAHWIEIADSRTEMKPLTFLEIYAWSQVTGNVLLPFELAIVRRLDRAFLDSYYEKTRLKAEADQKSAEKAAAERKRKGGRA